MSDIRYNGKNVKTPSSLPSGPASLPAPPAPIMARVVVNLNQITPGVSVPCLGVASRNMWTGRGRGIRFAIESLPSKRRPRALLSSCGYSARRRDGH